MGRKQDTYKQYMVDFDLPNEMGPQFLSLIPRQRELINQLFVKRRLMSYSLALDRKKLWATLLAKDEAEVVEMLEELPLTPYMTYQIHPLMFNELMKRGLPAISLN